MIASERGRRFLRIAFTCLRCVLVSREHAARASRPLGATVTNGVFKTGFFIRLNPDCYCVVPTVTNGLLEALPWEREAEPSFGDTDRAATAKRLIVKIETNRR